MKKMQKMKHFQLVLGDHLPFKSEVTITIDVIVVFREGILDRRHLEGVEDEVFIEKIVLVDRHDPLRCMSMIIKLLKRMKIVTNVLIHPINMTHRIIPLDIVAQITGKSLA